MSDAQATLTEIRALIDEEIDRVYRSECRTHIGITLVLIAVFSVSFLDNGGGWNLCMIMATPWLARLTWPRRIDDA